MNKKQITKKYNELLKKVATDKFYTEVDLTNRLNIYTCPNRHMTLTKDIDSGVTPFMTICSKCQELSQSSMYRVPEIAKLLQEIEEVWYRPTLKELLKIKNKETIEHVLKGGLLNKPYEDARI